jgi:hypothetical protein
MGEHPRPGVWKTLGTIFAALDVSARSLSAATASRPSKTDALLMDFAQDVGKGWGRDRAGVLFRKSPPPKMAVLVARHDRTFMS